MDQDHEDKIFGKMCMKIVVTRFPSVSRDIKLFTLFESNTSIEQITKTEYSTTASIHSLPNDNRRGGLVVRASALCAGSRGFNPRPRPAKVFKTGNSGFSL